MKIPKVLVVANVSLLFLAFNAIDITALSRDAKRRKIILKSTLEFKSRDRYLQSEQDVTCEAHESLVELDLTTDSFGCETFFTLGYDNGTIIDGVPEGYLDSDTNYRYPICLPSDGCYVFTMYDSFGDGLNSPGGYFGLLDGVKVGEGGDFGLKEEHLFGNCTGVTNTTDDGLFR